MSPAPLGQNFLGDPVWRKRIAEGLPIHAGETWIEIGAGHGEMTEFLAQRAAKVIAIELDAQLAHGLRKRAEEWPNVTIVESDVLIADLAQLAGANPFRVYGNIPYYITSPILHRIFAMPSHPKSAHLVMQLEVAERLVSPPGHREYGYLSVATQFYSTPEITLRIPPGAFRPPPKVDSALVTLNFPGAGANLEMRDTTAFMDFVQLCFAQKRKTLANNLRAKFSKKKSSRKNSSTSDKEFDLPELLRANNISATARAEELTVAQLAALFETISEDLAKHSAPTPPPD
jgi:16S rRNA (adenine1518-N6/adenine1519-N6)-dimethyltransferase